LLIWRRTRAPVMIGRDRLANGRALLEAHPEINILLCDDGLQHLRLHRDIEVIVFDERGAGNGWLLPAGPLREPWQTPPTPGLVASPLVLYNAEKPSTPMAGYLVKRHTTLPVPLDDWWSGRASNDVLHPRDRRNTAVWAMAGMAQPQRFFDALSSTGFQVTPLPLADHADLSTLPWPHEVRDLIVTEKDAVKLVPSRVHTERPLTRVWVARLDFQPEDAFWSVLDQALAARMPPGGLPRQPC
jgi:tetraacyldisaccharide 4'-kinase